MKEKDTFKRDILRLVKNQIETAEKEALREYSEEEVIEVVTKYRKTVKEQIDDATVAGRLEKVEAFQNELEIVMKYLPEQLSEQEIRDIVSTIVKENGFSGKQDLGKTMGLVTKQTKGKADGKFVNKIVVEILG
ncbi:glutamyl-tRNA(Gln) amidotransferase subunit E [compost metagenome]